MEDEEFDRELNELTEMLKTLRKIRDREQRRKFKAEIRLQLAYLMRE